MGAMGGGAVYHGTRLGVKGVVATGQAPEAVASAASNLSQAIAPDTRTRDYTQSLGIQFMGRTAKLLLASRAIKN